MTYQDALLVCRVEDHNNCCLTRWKERLCPIFDTLKSAELWCGDFHAKR